MGLVTTVHAKREGMERKLTAILCASVAGYSRLAGLDEEGTHQTLKVHLGLLMRPSEITASARIFDDG